MALRLSPFLRWPLRSSRPVAATHDGAGGAEGDATDRPERICIVNFTGERVNWGCRATSWELVRLLNRQWSGERPFALDVIPLVPHHALDREIPARHGPALRAALECPAPGPEAIALVERVSRERYLHLVDRLARADLVIFQGEGTMTGTDFPRAERLLLLPWLAAHGLGKRVISLNQTLFSADPAFTPALLATLGAMERVWVREPAALAWLEAQGFEGARLVPDTAWLTDPLEHGDLWKTLPERDFFYITGGAALAREAVEPYLDLVGAIAERTGLFPVFTCSTPLDRAIVQAAETRWAAGSFVAAPVGLVYPAVAELLGRARFLIGGRYHLSLLAAIGGTPSIPCATNTPKFAGLAGLLGVPWPIRGFGDSEGLMGDALALLADGPAERARLKVRSEAIRAEVVTAYAGWYARGDHAPRASSARAATTAIAQAEARALRGTNARAETGRTTRRVEGPVPEKNEPLWGGLVTVQLTRGDTTNNLLERYACLLEPTPHLLAIWRELLGRIRDNDSVMAALNAPWSSVRRGSRLDDRPPLRHRHCPLAHALAQKPRSRMKHTEPAAARCTGGVARPQASVRVIGQGVHPVIELHKRLVKVDEIHRACKRTSIPATMAPTH